MSLSLLFICCILFYLFFTSALHPKLLFLCFPFLSHTLNLIPLKSDSPLLPKIVITPFCVYFLLLFFFLSLPLFNTGSSKISDFMLPNPTGFHFQILFLVSHLVFMPLYALLCIWQRFLTSVGSL